MKELLGVLFVALLVVGCGDLHQPDVSVGHEGGEPEALVQVNQESMDADLRDPTERESVRTEVKPVRETCNKLLEKLKTINIPSLQFFESPLPEVAAELQRLSKQFDLVAKDPAKKGVNVIVLNPGNERTPKVTITLNGMALDRMITFITEMVGWTFDVRNDAVIISRHGHGRPVVPRETQFFEVPQGTIVRMTGGAGGSEAPDPFAPSGNSKANDTSEKIRKYFEMHGVVFDHHAGDRFVFDGFQIIVTVPEEELKKITRLIAKLDPGRARQVTLDVIFLPLQPEEVRKMVEALQKTKGELGHPLELEEKTLDKLLEGIPEAERPHAMRFTTMDGQTAHSENRRAIFPPEPSKGGKPLFSADTTLEFTPRVERYDTVVLELNLEHSYFSGFSEIKPGQQAPSIRTQTINTTLMAPSGEWLLIGGHSENDKHPVVALLRALVHL